MSGPDPRRSAKRPLAGPAYRNATIRAMRGREPPSPVRVRSGTDDRRRATRVQWAHSSIRTPSSRWWQAIRSVTTPRVLGVYAIEWAPSADADEVLGRLGGVFHGTIVEYIAGTQLFVADAWWLPPDGDPLGPMGLQVSCAADGSGCRLHVQQAGYEDTLALAAVLRGDRARLAGVARRAERIPGARMSRETRADPMTDRPSSSRRSASGTSSS